MRQHALPVRSVSAPQVGGKIVYRFTERSSPTERYQQTALADLLKGSVHEGVLAQILLGGTQHDDLLQFLGVCAQVSRAWWSVASASSAYGQGLARSQLPNRKGLSGYEGGEDERTRVLKAVSTALGDARRGLEEYGEQRPPGTLDLDFSRIGNEGARALGAALLALPTSAPRIVNLCLSGCELTSTDAIESVLTAMRGECTCCSLSWLSMSDNPDLGCSGDKLHGTGLAALSKALPPTLEKLELSRVGCSDAGMIVLAVELPRLASLLTLDLGGNSHVTANGWSKLIEALPALRVLQNLRLRQCGIDSSSARKIANVLPRCALTLSSFWLAGNLFDEVTMSEMQVAWGARTIGGIAFARN